MQPACLYALTLGRTSYAAPEFAAAVHRIHIRVAVAVKGG